MGDRSNIGFKDGNNIVFVYGHWLGSNNMTTTLKRALQKASNRWSDPSYATRIAISSIIGEDHNKDTGWGITINYLGDNDNYYTPVVDWENLQIKVYDSTVDKFDADTEALFVWHFNEYFTKMQLEEDEVANV